MNRVNFLLRSVTLAAAFVFSAQIHSAPKSQSDSIVVLISVDGLAAYYFEDPKAEMPNIRALAKAGARASSMKAVTPTVTWPNHTTLVTGVMPARHGVVGNNFYDRKTKKNVTLIFDPVYDKEEIIKVPTIYDAAKASGMQTAAVNWPASRNAPTLDWTIPEVRIQETYFKYVKPSFLEECNKNGISLMEEIFPGNVRDTGAKSDEAYTRVVNMVINKHRPQLALFHIGNVDHVEHEQGPKSKEAYAAIKVADAEVGAIWKELQRDFPGKATLLVVSDHGFSPIKSMILPNVVLRQAGLIEVDKKKITRESVHLVTQGGAAMLYVMDEKNRKSVIEKVQKAFHNVKGVAKVVGPDQLKDYGVAIPKDDPNAPDMILFAKLGYSFGDTAAGELPFNEKPERFGSHGHDPAIPELHATFVAWGAGIKAGAQLGEIENIDVAPTMAKLLKIPFPSADGKPLSAILAD
ncbi:MAG: phnA [Verrucomicrobiales bacterium]|nr:phnA [Verrucomicrobiales bacterium]